MIPCQIGTNLDHAVKKSRELQYMESERPNCSISMISLYALKETLI